MGTVLIDHRGAQLQHSSGALVLQLPGERPQNISLNLVSRVVLAASVRVDSSLLTHMAERGISVVAMSGRGVRRSAIMYSMGHGDANRRLNQYRMVQNEDISLVWARRFVLLKMVGQQRLLRHALVRRPEHRLALTRGIDDMASIMSDARTVEYLDSLRGLEGAATAQFFRAYRVLFAETLSFANRNRRPPRDPVNASLSLGYTMAHGEAIAALAQAGLDPMLGFLHDVAYGRESLACDLVELARPRIERLVWRLFAEQQLIAGQFTLDNGASRMGKTARQVFFQAYERNANVHRAWFRRYARVLARSCSDDSAAEPWVNE